MTFYTENTIKALRKPRQCGACLNAMPVGSGALYCRGKWEGDFWTGHYHIDCREAEVAINGHYNVGIEWIELYEFDDCDLQFIRDKWPQVLQRVRPKIMLDAHNT